MRRKAANVVRAGWERAARVASAPARRKREDHHEADGSAGGDVAIGLKLKHARLTKGLRLRELAHRLGCSEGFLSKVENDKVRPSLALLHRLVRELEVNIAVLFDPLPEQGPVQIMVPGKRPLITLDPILKGRGVVLERMISTGRGMLLEANIHHVKPGGRTDGTIAHEGEELGYVLEGRLQLEVDGKTFHVSKGDCFFFRSELKHQYRNLGKTTASILWVCTPPTF
jgi:transcriptional regulator with XRE-family HTH domain